MERYVSEYGDDLRRRGAQESTIGQESAWVEEFYRYLEEKGIREINREALFGYADYLTHEYRDRRGKPLKETTLRLKLAALKRYFQYGKNEKKYLASPAEELKLPKVRQEETIQVPTRTEIEAVIEGIRPEAQDVSNRKAVAYRDRAILELLYSSGIRAGELVRLELYDIDFEKELITIRQGKGRKDRVVPLGRQARERLMEYINKARPNWVRRWNARVLFFTERGTVLSYPRLKALIRKYRGENKKITAHKFRHACATEMMKNGADIRYIQELLGHKYVTTTQIYTHVLPVDLKRAHERYHPRGKERKLKSG